MTAVAKLRFPGTHLHLITFRGKKLRAVLLDPCFSFESAYVKAYSLFTLYVPVKDVHISQSKKTQWGTANDHHSSVSIILW